MSKDYYKVLGVEKNASQDEIKKAFRKKAHEFHPDKTHGDEAKFKEANEAYQVLGDQAKRSKYDQFGSDFSQAGMGSSGFEGFSGQGFSMDDLGEMFGGFGDIFGFGGGRQQTNRQGNDMQIAINITFEEAVFGTEKEIRISKKIACDSCHGNGAESGSKIETCKNCNGTGRVTRLQRTMLGTFQTQATCSECNGEGRTINQKCHKCSGHGNVKDSVNIKIKIPSGIDNGQTLRLAGQGEAGERSTAAGDLYVNIKVEASREFRRDGFTIFTEVEIGFSMAALGGKVEVKTIDDNVTLKIPAGTQSGKQFLLREHGIQKLNARGRGDQVVTIIVKTPTNLNRAQRKLLEDLDI